MVMHHPKVRGVLIVENGDQTCILLDELAFPVLHPGAADLLQSSGEAFELCEAVQLQAGVDRLQACRQPERCDSVQATGRFSRPEPAPPPAQRQPHGDPRLGLILSLRRHARPWASSNKHALLRPEKRTYVRRSFLEALLLGGRAD